MPRSYDDDDDRPRKRPRPRDDDDDDDRPRARRRARDDEDDYDDRPRKKRRSKLRAPQTNIVGVISLVVGILAVLFSFIPCIGLYAFIPGGLGLILGGIGLVLCHTSDGRYERKMPIIGLSVNAVAILFGLSWILVIKHWEKKFDDIGKDMKQAQAEFEKEEAARKKEQASAAREVKAAEGGGAVRVTAVQFAQAYEQDEEQADRWYKNKVLEVTGTVDEVDFTGETYSLHLKAGADSKVFCEFAKTPEVRARLAQLQPGTQVTIRGKCLGDGPTIEACVLVE